MRENCSIKRQQRGGPGGIRPAFWLATIIALGLCAALMILTLCRQMQRAKLANTTTERVLRTSGARTRMVSARLNAEEARRLAWQAANAKALELFGVEPFDLRYPAHPEQTGWKWIARRGHGVGDYEATVQLGADGSVISAEVLQLVMPPEGF